MSDFETIGKLVIKVQDLLDTIKGGAISSMKSNFESLKNSSSTIFNTLITKFNDTFNTEITKFKTIFDDQLIEQKNKFDAVIKPTIETINDVDIYNSAGQKHYVINGKIEYIDVKNNDDYILFSTGSESQKLKNYDGNEHIVFFDLIEFNSTLGATVDGDKFRVEFYQDNQSKSAEVGEYLEHFVFTGISFNGAVSGLLEVKKATKNGLSLFISQPEGDKEISITNALEGKMFPVSLRDASQVNDGGSIKLTIKMDSAKYKSFPRHFNVDCNYTSNQWQPPVTKLSLTPPKWNEALASGGNVAIGGDDILITGSDSKNSGSDSKA